MDMISGLRYEAARRKREAEAKAKAEADAKIGTTESEPAAGVEPSAPGALTQTLDVIEAIE